MMALTRGCRKVLRLNSIRKDGAISNRGWARKFDDPIPVAKGKELVTLRDAALYITKLPKAEHDAEEWQAAVEALLLVAEHDGPTMFAGIGVMRALHRHKPKARPAPHRKAPKVYRFIR